MRAFATSVPGLAPMVGRELSGHGIGVVDTGFDGRADVVLFEITDESRALILRLRTTEDVFVEVGRTLRKDGDDPGWIARRIWRPARVRRALKWWAAVRGDHAGSALTYRVVTRVLQERSFLRTELRNRLVQLVQREEPSWRVADPARIEIWVSEYRRGRFIAGLRLSDARMRQHAHRAGARGSRPAPTRVVERPGALRPAVAAAMVRLAGPPAGALLDPFCGSGTILGEAVIEGWQAIGIDIDPAAVEATGRNVPAARVRGGDATRLDLAAGSVGCCVSNLPHGQRYRLRGDPRRALSEMVRVTKPGGRIILLAPELPRTPAGVRLWQRFPVRLLGTKTTIWAYDRV